jgi:2-iminobutanoate/2-iminopropanoate deaminase
MPRQVVRTNKVPTSPFFSNAVKAAGLVFVAGQGPFDPATGEVRGTTIQEQLRQCLRNVSAILADAGSSLDKVVSATVIFAEESDFPGINEEWQTWFPAGTPGRAAAHPPEGHAHLGRRDRGGVA